MTLKKLLSFSKLHIVSYMLPLLSMALFLGGCGESDSSASVPETKSVYVAEELSATSATSPPVKGSRDNTSLCLVPTASGEVVYQNDYAVLDASNSSEGYVIVRYIGNSGKVKLQITGPLGVTYTYNLTVQNPTDEVFPLQSGDGEYLINVYENIEGTQYTTVFSQLIEVALSDEFKPFLYPNQYVNFEAGYLTVKEAEDLAFSCNSDLEVVSAVYNFMIDNIIYDYEEAETVKSGYIPQVDEVLLTKKGICLDYAALMTSMLRSQRIPTRMEIGYAGTAYHAWLSTYIKDIGWVNGMIRFDGKEWSLMDPTFASNTEEETLKDFIGDGTNYSVKYIY